MICSNLIYKINLTGLLSTKIDFALNNLAGYPDLKS